LATTLAGIAERHQVAHRDLKPDNLFWLGGRPVIGDFGIAHLPDGQPMTSAGRKLGPWGFIAPEALNGEDEVNWLAADVYSLAKCLWATATARPYPIQGTLYVPEPATSLYAQGGSAGLALGRLLEIATAHRSHERPSMRRVADELTLWLGQHPAEAVKRPASTKRVTFSGFPDLLARRADAGGPEEIGKDSLKQLLNDLRDLHAGRSEIHEVDDNAISFDLADVGIHDPDWSASWFATKALTWPSKPGLRLVAHGFGEGNDDITYTAQWHAQDADGAWRPASSMMHSDSEPRLPSDTATRRELAASVAANMPS
jgi:serine/threonine protein kinase